MSFGNKKSISYISDQQISELTSLLVEVHGFQLANDELSDQIGLLLENISGFETINEKAFHSIINLIRREYNESIGQDTSGS